MEIKILVVDDEEHIRKLIQFYLNKFGFETIEANNGQMALDIIENKHIDLIVVDIMMPIMDGYEFVSQVKKIRDIPTIMLTAKDSPIDKLKGFDLGIDDYVVKPFHGEVLVARIKSILKRYNINANHIITIQNTILDGKNYLIQYNDEVIHLPLKQFEIVFEMAKEPNHIFSRETLIERIWGMDYDGFDRTVDVHIKRIRENLRHIEDFQIITVRGLGYKLELKGKEK